MWSPWPVAFPGVVHVVHATSFFSLQFMPDADLDKVVLTCSQVALSMWKVKYLFNDTESELGLSSEDEADGVPPHRAVARWLPAHAWWCPIPVTCSSANCSVIHHYSYVTSCTLATKVVTFLLHFMFNCVVTLPSHLLWGTVLTALLSFFCRNISGDEHRCWEQCTGSLTRWQLIIKNWGDCITLTGAMLGGSVCFC